MIDGSQWEYNTTRQDGPTTTAARQPYTCTACDKLTDDEKETERKRPRRQI
ncbi:hypothetical protein Csa_000163 [Cucumis sativus]|uniref:Uncharacterized protein n=1 Tax=Cucumis sativus TaxID=3659 RepID=A0A0A0KS02_CUCSA|nr:hypothetical protein Csa_000163 [Cucumis sativus]